MLLLCKDFLVLLPIDPKLDIGLNFLHVGNGKLVQLTD